MDVGSHTVQGMRAEIGDGLGVGLFILSHD